jgi:hypothetical protein
MFCIVTKQMFTKKALRPGPESSLPYLISLLLLCVLIFWLLAHMTITKSDIAISIDMSEGWIGIHHHHILNVPRSR